MILFQFEAKVIAEGGQEIALAVYDTIQLASTLYPGKRYCQKWKAAKVSFEGRILGSWFMAHGSWLMAHGSCELLPR